MMQIKKQRLFPLVVQRCLMPLPQGKEVTGRVASLTGVGRTKLRSRVAPMNCRKVDGDGTAENAARTRLLPDAKKGDTEWLPWHF
jgi:hypothetical protein